MTLKLRGFFFANSASLDFLAKIGPPTAMKTKVPSTEIWPPPKETAVQKAARIRKLRAILKKGMGMSPKELKDSLWPGYAETYRSESGFRVIEPKDPYGKHRPRR